MPRHSRVILPGYTYHLTHRCHDREFLLRFQPDRNTYREWLREGASRQGAPVLGYCVTSSHVHVVSHAEAPEPVSAMMRPAAGCIGRTTGVATGRQVHCKRDLERGSWLIAKKKRYAWPDAGHTACSRT